MRKTALVALAALGVAGCGDEPNPVICTAIAVSALTVTVLDAATNTPICDAEVVVTDGGFRETLPVFPGSGADCRYSGPFERPGTYEVTVRRAGYPTAAQSGIRVTSDECHVIGVPVTVRLTAPR
jgi:Carboxypeptidase regulatory-like domain